MAAQGTLRRCWLHNISQQPSAPPRYCAYWHFENMFWRQKNILEVCCHVDWLDWQVWTGLIDKLDGKAGQECQSWVNSCGMHNAVIHFLYKTALLFVASFLDHYN